MRVGLESAVLKLRRQLPLVALGVLVVAVVGAWVFDRSVFSAVFGGLVGLVLALVTGFTFSRAVRHQDLQAAFIGLDYVAKAVLLIGGLLVSRHLAIFDHRVVGVVLVASILLQLVSQSRVLTGVRGSVVTPAKDAQNLKH